MANKELTVNTPTQPTPGDIIIMPAAVLTCPYHGWSYSIGGKLVGVPYFREVLCRRPGSDRGDAGPALPPFDSVRRFKARVTGLNA